MFHSFPSTGVHLIVHSFIQQMLAELSILGTGGYNSEQNRQTLSLWMYIPVGGMGNEQVKIFFTADGGTNSITT